MKRAENFAPAMEAAEAVKTYLRLHREHIVEDTELLSLLLPERFERDAKVQDLQSFVIEKLKLENERLTIERDRLRRAPDSTALVREGVQKLVLDLISASSFEETITIAANAAPSLGADLVSFGVESTEPMTLPTAAHGVRLLPGGLVDSLIGRDAIGAVLKGGHEPLFAGALGHLQSVAIFRMRLALAAPPALYAVGANTIERFDNEDVTREIAHFVRALERAVASWLDLPKN